MAILEETNILVRPAVRFSGAEQCITIPAQQHNGNSELSYRSCVSGAFTPTDVTLSQGLVCYLNVYHSQFY